ncbi:MAG: hypothetical protein ABIS50_24375 [Luteolibacter sp.]
MRFYAILFPLLVGSLAAAVEPTLKDHALRYFGQKENVIMVSVVKSWFMQVREFKHSNEVERSNEIITVFRVEEAYKGALPVGFEICCFHRDMEKKHLEVGSKFIFETATPLEQVHFLDTGELVPIEKISKLNR